MIPFRTTNKGLVKTIILLFIVLLVLAYLGFNIPRIISSPTFQDNWNFIKNLVVNVWNNYLKVPLTYLWDNVFVPLIWKPTVNHIQNIENATSSTKMTTFAPPAQAAQ